MTEHLSDTIENICPCITRPGNRQRWPRPLVAANITSQWTGMQSSAEKHALDRLGKRQFTWYGKRIGNSSQAKRISSGSSRPVIAIESKQHSYTHGNETRLVVLVVAAIVPCH